MGEPANGQPPAAGPAERHSGDKVETTFARLIGRQSSQPQRERLYRLRDVLGLRDDDALWSIVAVLEDYDALFRAYPAQMAERVEQATVLSLERTRTAMITEAAGAHRALSEAMARRMGAELARGQGAKPIISSLVGFGFALSSVVVFGALCMLCGYELAMTGRPFWMADRADGWGRALLGGVLGAPAGWMVFALLLPAAWRGGCLGWQLAGDPAAAGRELAVGWSLVVACALGAIACAAALVRIL